MSHICRLCLSTESDCYLETEKIEHEQFQIVLPEIDLNIINSPLICASCTKTLQTAYSFKSSCLETERLLESYIRTFGRENLNLKRIVKDRCVNDVILEQGNDHFVDNDSHDESNKEFVGSKENASKLTCPIRLQNYKNTHLNFHISLHLNVEKEMNDMVSRHLGLYSNENHANFMCQIFKESLINRENLIKHVKSHFALKENENKESENQLSREFCSKTFSVGEQLVTHSKTHSQKSRDRFCNKRFAKLSSMKQCLTRAHDRLREINLTGVTDHEIAEDSMKGASNECLEVIIKNEGDDTNFDTNSVRPFKCHLCPKTYIKNILLKKHLLMHKRLVLEKHKPQMEANLKSRHSDNLTKSKIAFKCEICGQVLQSKRNFLKHKETHVRNRNVTCYQCNREFGLRCNLIRHIKTIHQGKIQKMSRKPKPVYTCKTCGAIIKARKNLEEHMRIHTGERPHKCDECGKTFTQSGTLSTHKKTIHSDERPFTCEYCSKRFKMLGSLTKHVVLIHNPEKLEKKLKCTRCEKSFFINSELRRHMKWHDNDRQHSCDICGKCFVSSSGVKKHRVTHFDEKKHKCEICGKGFHQKYNIKTHMKVHMKV